MVKIVNMLQPNAPVKYKTLIIVESPSKCRTIERYLGSAYKCVASCGHLRELSTECVIADNDNNNTNTNTNNEPKYTLITKKMHYVRQIKLAISECNGTILLGTDADREGEAIAWHVCQIFNLPVETTPRIVFNEITQSALETAVRNPRFIDMNLVHSQQARQLLDLLIGYKMTPLLWGNPKLASFSSTKSRSSSKKSILSAGRCQTPALRLIYDNDTALARTIAEIAVATVSPTNDTHVYNCHAYFTSQHIKFSLSHPIKLDDISTFLASYSCKTHPVRHVFRGIAAADIRRITRPPPTAFKTSTLQQAASAALSLSPSETMECAQALYERGLITYHRTDETRTSAEFRSRARAHISATWGETYVRREQEEQEEQEYPDRAHEAIRPINPAIPADKINMLHRDKNMVDEITTNECRVYHLIWSRAIQSRMAPATWDAFTARVDAIDPITQSVCYGYAFDSSNPVFPGWTAAADRKFDNDNESGDNYKPHLNFLQNIAPGSSLPHNEIVCTIELNSTLRNRWRSETRYTEGSLVARLEALGIGRPSTFAAILHKLQKRQYVVKRDIIRNFPPTYAGTRYIIRPNGTVETISANCAPSSSAADTFHTDNAFLFGIERNKLQLTDLGRGVIETFVTGGEDEKKEETGPAMSAFAYGYTKQMEDALDAVAIGARDWRDVCNDAREICKIAIQAPLAAAETAPAPATANSVLRVINKYTSVRDGKYGAYVFHQPPNLKKPKFVPLRGFNHNALQCDSALLLEWVDERGGR